MRVVPRSVLALILLVALLALAAPAPANYLSIGWNSPTANADGTPLELVGYRIYFGATPTGAAYPPCNAWYVDVANSTAYLLDGLSDGQYYIQITARNSAGSESQCSNETAGYATAPAAAPWLPAPATGDVYGNGGVDSGR